MVEIFVVRGQIQTSRGNRGVHSWSRTSLYEHRFHALHLNSGSQVITIRVSINGQYSSAKDSHIPRRRIP